MVSCEYHVVAHGYPPGLCPSWLLATINYSACIGEEDRPERFAAKLGRVVSILTAECSCDRPCWAEGVCDLCGWVVYGGFWTAPGHTTTTSSKNAHTFLVLAAKLKLKPFDHIVIPSWVFFFCAQLIYYKAPDLNLVTVQLLSWMINAYMRRWSLILMTSSLERVGVTSLHLVPSVIGKVHLRKSCSALDTWFILIFFKI